MYLQVRTHVHTRARVLRDIVGLCVRGEREKERNRWYKAHRVAAVRSDKFSSANWKSRSSALVPSVFAVARENRHRVSNRVVPTGYRRSAVSLLFLIITGQPIYRGERFARDFPDVNSLVEI